MDTEKTDETLEGTGTDASPGADTLEQCPPPKKEKTVRGQLLKLAAALAIVVLLLVMVTHPISPLVFIIDPQGPSVGYGLTSTFADGIHTIKIGWVGEDTPESAKNIDILCLGIFSHNWKSCLLEPTPLSNLDTVENVSFIDVEPYGLLSIGDKIIIRNSFFNTSGRYNVWVGLFDTETATLNGAGGSFVTLEVTV